MSQYQNTFDIFISYSRVDNADASVQQFTALLHKLYEEVYSSKLTIFFDIRDIEYGENWERRLHNSLKNAHLMLAFVSENYIASEWCRKEWRVWCEVERSRGWLSSMLFPVYHTYVENAWQRVQDFEFKKNIFNKNSILYDEETGDAVRSDQDACLADLFSRQLVDITTWSALDDHEKRTQILSFVKTLHKKIQQAQTVTAEFGQFLRPNIHFRGRIYELKSLRACFARAQKGLVPIIHGIAGEGKTAFAMAYGHAFAYDYPGGVFFVPCSGMETLKDCFYALASTLSLQINNIFNENLALQQIWQWLQNRPDGRCLVIFDHVDNTQVFLEKDLTSLIRSDDAVHVLMTTRCACHSLGTTAIPIHMGKMQVMDAFDVLGTFRSFCRAEEEAVLKIIESLGAHVLSLQLAGAFLRENEDVSYEDFAAELMNEGVLNVLEQTTDVAKNIDYSAFKSIEKLVLPSIEKCSPEEKSALQLIALLAPDNVIAPWIQNALEILYPKTMRKKGLKNPWAAMVRKFNGLSLWQEHESKDMYSMHRLVRELIHKHYMEPSTVASLRSLLYLLAVEKADTYKDGTASWPLTFFLELLPTLSLWRHGGEKSEDFLCLLEVLMSKIVRGTGHEMWGIELINAVLPDIATRANSLHNLVLTASLLACRGQSFLACGDTDKALSDYDKALSLLKSVPIDSMAVSERLLQKCVEIYDYAGEAQREQGNIQRALSLHEAAFSILEKLSHRGEGNVFSLEMEKCYTWDHIARTHRRHGRDNFMQQALEFYTLSLEKRQGLCKEEPTNLRLLRDLANSHDAIGELYSGQTHGQAEQYYARALEIRLELHQKDPDNILYKRDLSIAYNHRGDMLLHSKNMVEAEEFFRKALRLRKDMFEKDLNNYQIAYDYSFSLLKVGDVCLAKNVGVGADDLYMQVKKLYEDAKKIRKNLVAKLPGKTQWYSGLAGACYKCAALYAIMGQIEFARENLLLSQDILKNIMDTIPECSPQRGELENNVQVIQQKMQTL